METTHLRIPAHVLYRPVPGAGGVLLDLSQREYFALGGVAARMWEVMAETGGAREIVEVLLTEYEVDRESLEVDVERFLGSLADRNLIQRSEA